MPHFVKIFQQSFWQILGKVVTSLSTVLILGLVARSYGKEGTGVFTLTLTYLAIFYLLADFGFNAHVLRRVESRESRVKEWQKLLGTRLVWSAVLVILAVGLLPFWPFSTPEFTKAVLFGGLAITFSGVFVTCNLIFQSKLRYDLSVLASSLGTLISLGVLLFLINLKISVAFLLFAHLIGWIAISFGSLLLVRKFLNKPFPIFSINYTKNLFRQSWPLAVTLAANVVYFRADSFMIAYFKGVSDVGIYNVAYSVFQSVLVLPTFIMNSYYPLMLRSLGGVKFMGVGLLGLSFFASFLTVIFSPLLINILTGGGFVGSTTSLQILSFGFPAFYLSSLLMWIMVTWRQYKIMLLLYTLGLVVNLILNFIFIPQFSYIAASWITVISEYLILGMQITILASNKFGSHKKKVII